ncbi:MAG: hypothetical protein QOF31_4486 [Mycobacterium sp.]|jgi:hypothetical protein|nr:hypothetical protein [Mycobacterium sp.]
MRTRWRRLLYVDDAEHLRGVAELFNLDGAHINPSPSKVGPLCERLPTEATNQRLLPLVAWLLTQRTVETRIWFYAVWITATGPQPGTRRAPQRARA